MEKSESIKNLAKALLNFNKLVGIIPKDSKNPFFKSSYAALPDILKAISQPLIDSGLVISQSPTGNHSLTTMLIHVDSGEYLMATYEMKPTKDDPQGIGSSITYQRRYAIGAILSLNIDEDDDGNKASTTTSVKTAQKKTPEQPIKKVESKTEDPKRPPALTEELFQKALKLTEKSRVEKALENYRMSNDMREELTVHLMSLDESN